MKDYAVAEDIVQDTFLKLLKMEDDVYPIYSLKGFLVRGIINSSINYLRHQQVHDKLESHLAGLFDQEPDDEVIDEELYHVIIKSIEHLPEQCQRVFKLSRYERMKNKENSG